ncbi:MAG: deoxyribose-phosphate aldolase [Bacteroidota bacterium]
MNLSNRTFTKDEINSKLNAIYSKPFAKMSFRDAYKLALNVIDLTTLEGSDTHQRVIELCEKAKGFSSLGIDIPNTAAVCVYPVFVETAKKALVGTNIRVASVAGAFPSGQSPIEVKVAEVKYAVAKGADDIDMVISRGTFLEGDYQTVFDEIVAIKSVCGNAHLKVILETGELQTPQNIYKASEIAIQAGADFIKTSTGKIAVNATPEAMLVMLEAIKAHYDATGKMVGIKPAGGIATAEESLNYLKLVENVLGEKWMNNQWLRFGASRLADKILEKLR